MVVHLPYGIVFDVVAIAAPLAPYRSVMVAIIWIGVLLSSVRLVTRFLGLGVSAADGVQEVTQK